MPIYLYKHPEKEEIAEILQGMNDKHEFFTEEGGEIIEWKRIFTRPQVGVDTVVDPYSAKDYVKYTGARKGTYGDLLEKSAELSQQRADKNGGEDPVKKSYFDDYKKKTGASHFNDKPKKIETKQAVIEF